MKRWILIAGLFLSLALGAVGCQGGDGIATGRPTLLFFWSEHCAFCPEVEPIVEAIEREYRSRLSVIYVSQDDEEGVGIARDYGVIGTPTILLLDSEGVQFQVLRGTVPEPLVRQTVEDLLAEDG